MMLGESGLFRLGSPGESGFRFCSGIILLSESSSKIPNHQSLLGHIKDLLLSTSRLLSTFLSNGIEPQASHR